MSRLQCCNYVVHIQLNIKSGINLLYPPQRIDPEYWEFQICALNNILVVLISGLYKLYNIIIACTLKMLG